MSKIKPSKRDLYYTSDHEWIDFQGSVAYVGICAIKLKSIKEISHIDFIEKTGQFSQGNLLATINNDERGIRISMPVNGKIISINEVLLTDDRKILLEQPENNGWIALIVPSQPYERKGLMAPDQYKQFLKKSH